ncbi:MAG: hypothetical protein IKS05_07720 [Oscillospiraceae bacterium]|nr:hypothetical protein [Oscillospiraceae bacterium]
MKHVKKLTALILTLLIVFGVAACGGERPAETPGAEHAPADSGASGQVPAETQAQTPSQTGEAAPETQVETGIDSIQASRARLLSFYHTADSTYIMAAFEIPMGGQHRVAAGWYIGEEGVGINFAQHENWDVAFTEVDGTNWNVEDFRLNVRDGDDSREFTFSMDDLADPEEYDDFGLYELSGRRAVFGWTLKHTYVNRKTNRCCRLDIKVTDVGMLDQDRWLGEADVSAEAFQLFAGDGTPAETLLGTPCVGTVQQYPGKEMTSFGVMLDFFPTKTDGTEEEQTALARELLKTLIDSDPYFTYTDGEGKVYTFPLSYDDIPPAYVP